MTPSSSSAASARFDALVGTRFQLYNSLFMSLPFNRIEKTGMLLTLLQQTCEERYAQGASPADIITEFWAQHAAGWSETDRLDLLFRFIQFSERQVVLFDALEDAAFRALHDNLTGSGTLSHLVSSLNEPADRKQLAEALQTVVVRPVLTAHPTQFYPGQVLGIINDLSKALAENDAAAVQSYLQQLGKTPFLKKTQPTPYDEAINLIWYLEQVFYPAAGQIIQFLQNRVPEFDASSNSLIQMGFWPGGDRDGNPFVTPVITRQVADALRGSIIKCYYLDIRKLKRRLTFREVDVKLAALERELYNNLFIPGQRTSIQASDIRRELVEIRQLLNVHHNGLFGEQVDRLIMQVDLFGLHFASLDIRQDSRIHAQVLQDLITAEGLDDTSNAHELAYLERWLEAPAAEWKNEAAWKEGTKQTIESMQVMRSIQSSNGEAGCNRYIISQCQTTRHVLEVLTLFHLSGWPVDTLHVDIVPLFETIQDLQEAVTVMQALYQHPIYRQHLEKRGMRQTIMLGFSDGTKDGGYLMANWSIFQAKKQLTALSAEQGVEVLFFDGRGGPPSRGGGKTHQFYASMGDDLSHREIQLTIQGQTISSNFGTVDAARYNLEQLIHAGVSNQWLHRRKETLHSAAEGILETLAQHGYAKYQELKLHPDFLAYLQEVSPLPYYNATNIASRPARRSGNQLAFSDLRAIPYVGAWAQLKQNVTGYFGVGTALKTLDEQGRWPEVQAVYRESLYFRTLMDNCEMALNKSFFPLTAYLKNDPTFGAIWMLIYQEFELSKAYLLRLSERPVLMAPYPTDRQSIHLRERIVLPLLTIQQYALMQLRQQGENATHRKLYEKLIIRTSFGIINAGRNSA